MRNMNRTGVVSLILLCCLFLSACGKRCAYDGCEESAARNYDYCYSHKCGVIDCPNPRIDEKGHYCVSHICKVDGCYERRYDNDFYMYNHGRYCKTHADELEAAIIVGSKNFIITDVAIEHNSVSTVCTGTFKSIGIITYKFVSLKGIFCDKDGNVIDTDSTYAVGKEGLSPGESTTFRMSVPKNRDITSCTVKVSDLEIASYDESQVVFHVDN